MPRLLLNCDQVFDVLTRGPFPSGEPTDEAVEHHLAACHECRSLAEALRPAVTLLHESMAGDDAQGLPEYQGHLNPRLMKLASRPPLVAGGRPPGTSARRYQGQERLESVLVGVRLAAASLLVAALGVLCYGFSAGGGSAPPAAGSRSPRLVASQSTPSAEGLVHLASLNLPSACFPPNHRADSREEARILLAAMEDGALDMLRCCTECHHAKGKVRSNDIVALQHCQACHRG